MNRVRLSLLILLALSLVPHFAAPIISLHDSRVEYVLHAMPAETQLVSVVNAPNIVFDQPVFQMPDPETCLQLFSVMCFWDIKSAIHQNDVSLCVHCTVEPSQGVSECKYPTGHFVFLVPRPSRDKQIRDELQSEALVTFSNRTNTIFELSGGRFVSMPKPALII